MPKPRIKRTFGDRLQPNKNNRPPLAKLKEEERLQMNIIARLLEQQSELIKLIQHRWNTLWMVHRKKYDLPPEFHYNRETGEIHGV